VTVLFHTFNIISPALTPYLSAGEFLIGADIMIFQGFITSIYAQIHSKLPFKLSSKLFASFGLKNTVYLSSILFKDHAISIISKFLFLSLSS
jgi:hypothetical protein